MSSQSTRGKKQKLPILLLNAHSRRSFGTSENIAHTATATAAAPPDLIAFITNPMEQQRQPDERHSQLLAQLVKSNNNSYPSTDTDPQKESRQRLGGSLPDFDGSKQDGSILFSTRHHDYIQTLPESEREGSSYVQHIAYEVPPYGYGFKVVCPA
ncbi:hypothetical protein HDV00_011036 [Rhizophlyctis rosea]|nr:hypothetical protein HDV00_011036 [Rhizophlyctis rosea]